MPPHVNVEVRQILDSQLLKHVRSKRDLYNIFIHVGQFHLPTLDDTTMFFMKEVLAGRKRLVKLQDLIPCNVPRLKEFKADILYQQAMADPSARLYLPDPSPKRPDVMPVSRKFLFNVSYPIGSLFS